MEAQVNWDNDRPSCRQLQKHSAVPGHSDEAAVVAHGSSRLVLADGEAKVLASVVEPERQVSDRRYCALPLRSGQIRLRERRQTIVVRLPPSKAAPLEP